MNRTLTPGYLQLAHTGLNKAFNKALNTDDGLPAIHTQLCIATSSNGESEQYDWMGASPQLEEIQGEQKLKNLSSNQISVTNKEFSALAGIRRDLFERDKLDLFKPRLMQIADAGKKWFDERLFDKMVKKGWDTKQKDWTGTAYFAANKPLGGDKKALSFTNAGTGALSASSFESAEANLRTRKDENGKEMSLGDSGFLLVCGPSLAPTARKIVKAENVLEGGAAVSNVNKDGAELRVWNRLNGDYANYWFLFAKAAGRAPFIAQTEVAPSTYMCTNPNDSYVIANRVFLFQAYARGEIGLGESLLAYGSTGAS